MFLGTAICFLGSLVTIVALYKAMQRVTVTKGLNHDCVFANASLHCYSAFELWEFSDVLLLFTAVHRLCFKFTIK